MFRNINWRLIFLITLAISVVTLGLLFALTKLNCFGDTSCYLELVTIAAIIEIFLVASLIFIANTRRAKSIREITETVRRMTAGDFSKRVLATSRDDLSNLTRAINHLTEQIYNQIGLLTDENKKFTTVLQNMADGVLITNQNGSVMLINPAAEKMLHRRESEVLGRPLAEVVRHYKLIELWQISRRESREAVAAVEIGQNYFLQAFVSPFQERGSRAYSGNTPRFNPIAIFTDSPS